MRGNVNERATITPALHVMGRTSLNVSYGVSRRTILESVGIYTPFYFLICS